MFNVQLINMENSNNFYFNFFNSNYPKLPAQIRAKYCFENELFLIPNTEVFFNVDAGYWAIYDDLDKNLFSMTNDQFMDIYFASDKKSQRYLEFVIDSKLNDYKPTIEIENLNLFEEIFGDLIEKEVPIKRKWRLIFDLFSNRKIYLSKYL